MKSDIANNIKSTMNITFNTNLFPMEQDSFKYSPILSYLTIFTTPSFVNDHIINRKTCVNATETYTKTIFFL